MTLANVISLGLCLNVMTTNVKMSKQGLKELPQPIQAESVWFLFFMNLGSSDGLDDHDLINEAASVPVRRRIRRSKDKYTCLVMTRDPQQCRKIFAGKPIASHNSLNVCVCVSRWHSDGLLPHNFLYKTISST
jgi:hypothetical protein